MRVFFAFVITLLSLTFAFGQNEQFPIVEKEITYNNWKLKNVKGDGETNLRDFAKGKKFVMVVYFAPWCPNWKHDAPILQQFYDKYKTKGLYIIAVGEYDPVDSMKASFDTFKLTFPVVYESESRAERQNTTHYQIRTATGDTRKWGSPWYIFLEPATLEKKDDVLLRKANVINGEIIEAEGEKFIRQKLGLPEEDTKTSAAKKSEIEVCDPDKTTTTLKKPEPKP